MFHRYQLTWCCVWRDAGLRQPVIHTAIFSTPSSETGLPWDCLNKRNNLMMYPSTDAYRKPYFVLLHFPSCSWKIKLHIFLYKILFSSCVETYLWLPLWLCYFTTLVNSPKSSYRRAVEIWNKRICCLESWPDNNSQNVVTWLLSERPHAIQVNSCACPWRPATIWYC